MESSLPLPEEILVQKTMSIVRINVTDQPYHMAKTTLFISTQRGVRIPLEAPVYVIDDERVRGYIPTKSLIYDYDLIDDTHQNPHLEMVFFTSPSLPDQVRPFAGGKTYVMLFRATLDMVLEYDIEQRILIDQQVVSATGDVYYIIVFGHKQYDDIVITPDHGEDVAVPTEE